MTRPFRVEEDERRYFALRSEFFIRLVQSGVPAQTVHEIMRNFGKLEDMMFFEGVRQGMVTALFWDVSAENKNDRRDPLLLHGDVYHGYQTPLTRVEDAEHAAHDAAGDTRLTNHPWLDKRPLEFGPLTLNEALEMYGPDLVVKTAPARVREAAPQPVAVPATEPEEPDDGFNPMAALDALARGEDPATVFGRVEGLEGDDLSSEPIKDLIEMSPEDDRPLDRPALLDKIRDILLRLDSQPKDWRELILMLMRETRHDAAYLDDLMSTPMGMTVISQANLFHLHPGAMPEIKHVPKPT